MSCSGFMPAAGGPGADENLRLVIGNAKSFFRYEMRSKNLNPPYPPFSKGGNLAKFH
jgi:hypothetical protein